ncbi:MAG: C40 family peptidase [Alphaproteobacteria bacterium]|nr:C40 family peptidase [Alphaproteobacteria bacterium]
MSDTDNKTNDDRNKSAADAEHRTNETKEAGLSKTKDKEITLDPRIFAYRADLAAQKLYGRVNAPRYSAGEKRQVRRAAIALRKHPDAASGLTSEALFGEHLTVYDEAKGWAWVQLSRDNYVGYMPADALTSETLENTHWVRAAGTFLYPVPDIKSPPLLHLSLTAEVTVKSSEGTFSKLAGGGYILTRHLAELSQNQRDYVEVAERLIETPYLWGGRTRIGIDCSGLVQISLKAAGIDAPRDSDMQKTQLGETVEINAALDRLKRGDLIFWRGHVGIMIDGIMMVHANAHHMSTVAEPLPEAASRIARDGGPITAIKRLPSLSA